MSLHSALVDIPHAIAGNLAKVGFPDSHTVTNTTVPYVKVELSSVITTKFIINSYACTINYSNLNLHTWQKLNPAITNCRAVNASDQSKANDHDLFEILQYFYIYIRPEPAWVPLECIMQQANESKLHLLAA